MTTHLPGQLRHSARHRAQVLKLRDTGPWVYILAISKHELGRRGARSLEEAGRIVLGLHTTATVEAMVLEASHVVMRVLCERGKRLIVPGEVILREQGPPSAVDTLRPRDNTIKWSEKRKAMVRRDLSWHDGY